MNDGIEWGLNKLFLAQTSILSERCSLHVRKLSGLLVNSHVIKDVENLRRRDDIMISRGLGTQQICSDNIQNTGNKQRLVYTRGIEFLECLKKGQ